MTWSGMENHAGGKGQAGALAGCHSSNCSAFSGQVETPDHGWKRRVFNNLGCEMAEDALFATQADARGSRGHATLYCHPCGVRRGYDSHSARERIFGSSRANSTALMLAAHLKKLQETHP